VVRSPRRAVYALIEMPSLHSRALARAGALTSLLLAAVGCGGGSGASGSAGAVTVPQGSPVSLAPRQPDGTVSGRYVDPSSKAEVTFSVTASGPSSAAASYAIDGQVIRIELGDSDHATVSSSAGGQLTGDGTAPADAASRSLLGSLGAPALRAIPLELGCGQGLERVELAALLVPWQLHLKYAVTDRHEEVRQAADAASCVYFAEPAVRSASSKPSRGGLLNPGNADPIPHVVGFWPMDGAGAVEPSAAPSASRSDPLPLAVSATGPCQATCRGACGVDCDPDNCVATPGPTACAVDARGARTCLGLTYTRYDCGVHQGCIDHDQCYDDCNAAHGCDTWAAATCRHPLSAGVPLSCDAQALRYAAETFGAGEALQVVVSWARGSGPFTGRQTFTYVTAEQPAASCQEPGLVCCSDGTQGVGCCGATALAAGNACCADGTQGPSCPRR
jgi:hypothetical protein